MNKFICIISLVFLTSTLVAKSNSKAAWSDNLKIKKIRSLHKTLFANKNINICIRCHSEEINKEYHSFSQKKCLECHKYSAGMIKKLKPKNFKAKLKKKNKVKAKKQSKNRLVVAPTPFKIKKLIQFHQTLFKKGAANISLCKKCHTDKFKSKKSHTLKLPGKCFSCHGLINGKKLGANFLRHGNMVKSAPCLDCHMQKSSIVSSKHDYLKWPKKLQNKIYKYFSFKRKISIQCQLCHDVHQSTTKNNLLLTSNIHNNKNKVMSACLTCHKNPGFKDDIKQVKNYAHPKIIFSSVQKYNEKIALNFYTKEAKLEENNDKKSFEVTCSTCHNPHSWSTDKTQNKSTEGNIDTSFLKSKLYTMEFCSSCHGENIINIFPDFHFRNFKKK